MRAAAYPFLNADFLAFAHRGGAHYPPNLHRENTRHAFQQAIDLGYRYLETDVHLSADGVLVAFHDSELHRVTDVAGRIGELTFDQISRARIGGQDPVPTLAELLEAFPQAWFNIDAKSDAAVEPLARTIAEHQAQSRVCVTSFGIRRLHRLRQLLGSQTPYSASSVGIAVNRFLPWVTGVLNTPAPVLQLPVDHRILGRRFEVLTDGLIAAAHRHGKQVHIWTIDDPVHMAALIDAGVDGIFTDRPDLLKSVLEQRGRWPAHGVAEAP